MIMSRLKAETLPRHEAVEATLGAFRMTGSLEGYQEVLRRFLGFHRPVEEAFAALSGWEAVGIDPEERRKAHMIEADLRALGVAEAEIAAVPRCPSHPRIETIPEALGAMYVLEGSTLGGQYIRKAVKASLGLTPENGCSYFASYGDRVGPMWKAFGAAVEAYAQDEPARDAITRSADATFAAVDAWFAAEGPSAR